ncbi:hypothetical protein [Lentibacillus sp. CBA3610]|uniref:hypothetical protein n=1 Tax=Lentibacillus sp. CBA3610 TaxID=2518176 RepID=UPI0015952BDD|nr:hypothetical protein [Lentibacillus sp. CBA3610]QKY68867.1 hypothetical protein Len3610_03835 [Lentibacillus sp. CBA3610]
MTQSLFIILLFIAYIIYVAFKYKKTWKKLSITQIAGVFVTFAAIAGIAGIVLFYGINHFVEPVVSGYILSFIIKFFAIIVIITIAGLAFASIASKITNGIIPNEWRDQNVRQK